MNKLMKKQFTKLGLLFFFVLMLQNAFAFAPRTAPITPMPSDVITEENMALIEILQDVTVEEFLELTPRAIKEKTGKKLKFKEIIALKTAQKKLKKAIANEELPADDEDKVLIYVLCFFIPPLAVYLMHEFDDNKFVVNLILSLLCGIPGIIHAFILASKYFK